MLQLSTVPISLRSLWARFFRFVEGWVLDFATTRSIDFLDWTWLRLFDRATGSQHHVEVLNVAGGFGFCCGVGEEGRGERGERGVGARGWWVAEGREEGRRGLRGSDRQYQQWMRVEASGCVRLARCVKIMGGLARLG